MPITPAAMPKSSATSPLSRDSPASDETRLSPSTAIAKYSAGPSVKANEAIQVEVKIRRTVLTNEAKPALRIDIVSAMPASPRNRIG